MEGSELWVQILAGLLMVLMLVFLAPRAKQAIQASRKGSAQEWLHFAAILGLVALFVLGLVGLL